jgi:cytochrome c oxidase assembly factor CtaG
MDMVLAHGDQIPPPLTPLGILTSWTFDPWVVVPVLLAAAVYLLGVRTLQASGTSWPVSRTVLWFVGLGVIIIATSSSVGVYDTAMFSMHSIQHMLLQMIAPAPLGMAAPVTLALRTLPPKPRRLLLAAVHSRPFRLLTHPLVAYGLFVVSPFVLIYSPLFEATLTNDVLHNLTHVHFVLVGTLLYWPLLGYDPLPNPLPFVFRLMLILGLGPAHIILGIPIMQMSSLLAEDYFVQIGQAWGTDPLVDQQIGGGLLWVFGDIVVMFMFSGMFLQWNRSERREQRRIDRHLDRRHGADTAMIPPWWLTDDPKAARPMPQFRDSSPLPAPEQKTHPVEDPA